MFFGLQNMMILILLSTIVTVSTLPIANEFDLIDAAKRGNEFQVQDILQNSKIDVNVKSNDIYR